jgi:tRNA pseudouridine55 synthase
MDGILLIDKPKGVSSAEVVRRIKARIKPVRVGHLGTLDPFASGLLPIVIGEATKLAPFLETADKEYRGIIQLGVETDTLDSEGQVTARATVPLLDASTLTQVEAAFSGEISQAIPVFSAVKHRGQRLYRLARKGFTVTPPQRKVAIYLLRLHLLSEDKLSFVLVCSKGTYVRALARDIGRALGSVGFLAELRRFRTAGFSLDQSCELDEVLTQLERHSGAHTHTNFRGLISLRDALAGLAEVSVDVTTASRVLNGDASALKLNCMRNAKPGPVKILFGPNLIAIAELCNGGNRLLRVFRPRPGSLYSS